MRHLYDARLSAKPSANTDETTNGGSSTGIAASSQIIDSLVDQSASIVIVEPRALAREGLTHLIRSTEKFRLIAVAAVEDLREHVDATGLRDCVVLLSLGSREVGSDDVRTEIATLSRIMPAAPIIVVCDREDSQQVGEALRQGIRGYIPTTMTSRVVLEAVRLVQAGGTFVPAGAFSEALTQRRSERPDPVPDAASVLHGLTPRQREVFDLLRRGKPNKIIAHELSMCESTVKVHVRQIMRKLRASNRTQAAFLAARIGQEV